MSNIFLTLNEEVSGLKKINVLTINNLTFRRCYFKKKKKEENKRYRFLFLALLDSVRVSKMSKKKKIL